MIILNIKMYFIRYAFFLYICYKKHKNLKSNQKIPQIHHTHNNLKRSRYTLSMFDIWILYVNSISCPIMVPYISISIRT